MLITPANLLALRTSFRAEFQGFFDTAESMVDKIATTIPSTTKSNTYGWLNQFPKFREWIGDRVLKSMAAQSYVITNKDWESTIDVLRTDIEDDNIGVYKPLFQEMGRAAKVLADELVFALLKVGDTTACYDGQYFFDVDHPVYPNVDGTGIPVVAANFVAGAGPAWYLLDCGRALKPMIYQDRKPPIFTHMTALDDESVFTSNKFRFGVDARSNVGFGFWQQAYKSNAALTDANFNAAYAAMGNLVADGGRPLGIRPTVLVVPPSLRTAGLDITKAALRNNSTNVNAGVVDLIVTPWVM